MGLGVHAVGVGRLGQRVGHDTVIGRLARITSYRVGAYPVQPLADQPASIRDARTVMGEGNVWGSGLAWDRLNPGRAVTGEFWPGITVRPLTATVREG